MTMNKAERNKEEALTQDIARRLGVEYLDGRTLDVEVNEDILPFAEWQQLHVLPLKKDDFQITLGYTEQTNRSNLDVLRERFKGENVRFVFVSEATYKAILEKFRAVYEPVIDPLKDLSISMKDVENQKLLEFIITKAARMNASDIHLEAQAEQTGRVRFRVDGVLHDIDVIPEFKFHDLIGRIKIESNANIVAKGSKTGHLNMTVATTDGQPQELNMRVELFATTHGEDTVIRLFTIDERYLSLEKIGLLPYHHGAIEQALKQTEGMILLAGPTGSGKTSSLYAIINQLDKSSKKIITLEDPVEYELHGVTQVPVDTSRGDSFAGQLRSTLREDPDVIMVGEIRDGDTVTSAVQAALTGHLVLSTFHANSAAGALSRIVDLSGKATTVASALQLVVSQRLVRRLCDACKQERQVTPEQQQALEELLSTFPPAAKEVLGEPKVYEAHGCDACQGIGYRGRIAVAEQMEVTPGLEKYITGQATVSDMEQYAVEQEGMVTLAQDALVKVLLGHTSLEEVEGIVTL